MKLLKASRPNALLLDGGDTWQGSATALWTNGQDMVDACKLLGVDAMCPHWEFTLGEKRVQEIVEKDFGGKLDFLAQNVKTNDFGDQVFKPYVIREMNGVPVAVIGQAFPYTPIANPRWMMSEVVVRYPATRTMSARSVDEPRRKAAQAEVIVLLSHNGFDVDRKTRLASVDRHRHHSRRPTRTTALPAPIVEKNSKGKTLLIDQRRLATPSFSGRARSRRARRQASTTSATRSLPRARRRCMQAGRRRWPRLHRR